MTVIFNGQQYELVRISGDLALIQSWCTVLCVPARELTMAQDKPAAQKKTKTTKAGPPRSGPKN